LGNASIVRAVDAQLAGAARSGDQSGEVRILAGVVDVETQMRLRL
jgi:hypothetical protein